MNLLSVEGIAKRFGERILFADVTFGLEQGQKMALVAKNGEGKTTLLEMLSGDVMPDSGNVVWRNGISIGYLRQDNPFNEFNTVKEVLYGSDNDFVRALNSYEFAIENPMDDDAMQKALNLMDASKAWDYEAKIDKLLSIFGMDSLGKNQPIDLLSGGQKKRIALIKLIVDEPDVFILDEPTNHLDISMIEWLEEYLAGPNISLFLVTHDRYFLSRVCNQILELDGGLGHRYTGDYEYFIEKKAEREENLTAEIGKAKNLYRKEIEWMRRMPKARATKAKSREDRFYDTEKKAKQRINKDEMQLSIKSERLGSKILELHHVKKSFDTLKIVDDFNYTFKKGDKIGIAGKNGVGKTTFLNLVMGLEEVDSGKIITGETVQFGYYTQKGIQPSEDKRIIDVVKDIAEIIPLEKGRKITASQLLEKFLFPPKQQYTYVSKLSGGEKKRLYLLTILMSNPNFLILDEPTNDLDIKTIQILEDFLREFPGCLMIVSHDRAFMDNLADHIFYFKGEGQIKDYNKSYSEIIEIQKAEGGNAASPKAVQAPKEVEKKTDNYTEKLSYNERREFNKLEKEIAKLEVKKTELTEKMNEATADAETLMNSSKEIGTVIENIEAKELRWLELSERA
ncbi:MAG: ABC-F family ATP-binding cassette domain-containing protein [Vicingaceae bacterium]|jgi:ATP-binding cassette subfamily F protein uup|tara:strand:+ start:1976 stop:3847 length:1872 start_codon:yes stop_codon:yes gene_type:complete